MNTRWLLPLVLLSSLAEVYAAQAATSYEQSVLAQKPVAYWRFEDGDAAGVASSVGSLQPGRVDGSAILAPGPRQNGNGIFPANNTARAFGAKSGTIRIKDPGANSPLDFAKGETITLEAWVQCDAINDGQQVYIVGKGRTLNAGMVAHNQNWALRLRGVKGAAHASFLFRDERNRPEAGDEDWHRWTSAEGFAPGPQWRHVVATYTFGEPESARAWIDGKELTGSWDMGGPTTLGPVVDDDEVWIGSSMGRNPNSTFDGALDEIAVYRTKLSQQQIAARLPAAGTLLAQPVSKPSAQTAEAKPKKPAAKAQPEGDPMPPPVIKPEELTTGQVRVEILEHAGQVPALALEPKGGNDSGPAQDPGGVDASWSTIPSAKTEEYTQSYFAFTGTPTKYNERGIKVDRSRPYLMRAAAKLKLPPGEHKLLLRTQAGARLSLDGEQLALTPHLKRKSGDAEEVPDQAAKQLVPGLRLLPPGHKEAIATVTGDGQTHVLALEAFVGGKLIRPEIGELSVTISSNGGPWRILELGAEGEPTGSRSLADRDWTALTEEQRVQIAALDSKHRRVPAEEAYWAQRREIVKKNAPAPVPVPECSSEYAGKNEIDHFIGSVLEKKNLKPSPVIDDAAFLRRLTLDTIGLVPTAEEVAAFLADQSADKRAKAINRLVADSRWADRWTPYWQDVLAENPNILKGTLNNTGPFRAWIYEALLDNKPMDRFATELIAMEGSAQYGGPAGFGIASQNDLPMAAKAQIISSAFLSKEMKCARCHDAPSHPFNQEDLFNIAAMLQRQPIKVPDSSLTKGLSVNSHVTVSLKAGQVIDPHWPFDDTPEEPLKELMRKPKDPREVLAATLTDPRNTRFAQVLVNRLWKEVIGVGIVEPVDDWEDTRPSHKELLAWLARELVASGYDLKHVARIIFNSELYQRTPTEQGSIAGKSTERFFAAPARRRMNAEQIVDSLFAVAGKKFGSELLTMDPEGRQGAVDHGNFGIPRRAWEFTGLSNERDRPALAKPRAQVVTDALATFGWRESRPEPRSTRDHEPNVLQPALLANGTIGQRIIGLSDDSRFTQLALEKQPLEALVQKIFLTTLSRPPTAHEAQRFMGELKDGYEQRLTGAPPAPPRPPITKAVSWANHLHPEATNVIFAIEKEVKEGDLPSPQLTADWRERMEDALWALIVSPEFVHLP